MQSRKMATFSRFARIAQNSACISIRRGHNTFASSGGGRSFRSQPFRRQASRTVEGRVVETGVGTRTSQWTGEYKWRLFIHKEI